MPRLLEVSDLSAEAATSEGQITLLKNVSLSVDQGEIVGVIGESGSGKTTTVRAIIGVLDRNVSIVTGEVRFDGAPILSPAQAAHETVQGSRIGMVFQGTGTSLDPMMKVGRQIIEVLNRHRKDLSPQDRTKAVHRVIEAMGFSNPRAIARSYPHQLSGGMRQRVSIAVAMITEPELLIADECTSALDVTTQQAVIKLLVSLVESRNMGMLFITHNIRLAQELCHRIVVMKNGQVVESGLTAEVLERPSHPYTRELLEAVPVW